MPKNNAFWMRPAALDAGLRNHVEKIRILDTHEHLDEEAVRLKQPLNLTRFFMYYAFDDVTTSGMMPEDEKKFFDDSLSAMEQWKLIRGFWPKAKNTAYCQAVRLSIKELYGIDDLRDDTIIPLMKAVEKRNKPGVLDWMLRDKCGIEACLVNANDEGDMARRTDAPGLFLFDIAVSAFCGGEAGFKEYEKASGVDSGSLEGCKKMIDWYFARWGKQAVAIKNVCAYWRTLYFEDVPAAQAAPAYEKWKKGKASPADIKAAQDHLFHHCIRRATDFDLAVKIHTGYHSGHNYSDMDLFRVRNLANLFRQYPSTRFDLFHMSYPEWPDLVALAKHYSNVWADMCWAWIIDPQASLHFLRSALHALPANKVFAFGGDYGFADVVYGHARIARDGVPYVLGEAAAEGRISRGEAKEIAARWLRENAMEMFRVEARRKAQAAGQPGVLKLK